MPGVVLHDEAGVRFLDDPRRREAAARHFGRHSTPSSDSAMRKATEPSMGSAPSAAALRSLATTRHDALSRQYAGKCRSISSRTSASVISYMTSGMISGRGSGRDQFGLGRGHSYATQTPARPENRPNRPGGRATDRRVRPIPGHRGYAPDLFYTRWLELPPRPIDQKVFQDKPHISADPRAAHRALAAGTCRLAQRCGRAIAAGHQIMERMTPGQPGGSAFPR